MLTAMRNSWLLFALFALFAVSSAIDVDGIGHFLHRGKRQAASGTGNSTPTSSDDNQQTSATPQPSSQPPRTSNPPATSQAPAPSSNAPSPTPASSNAQPTSGGQSSQAPRTSNAPSSGNANPTSSSQEVFTSALVATSVQQFTTVIVTESNGQQVSFTSTGSSTNLITTGQATITSRPTTNNGNSDSGKGITESSKKIIGGVVGGVGGAILLGGIALVCWRIWGRKKRVSEDDDDLMAGTGSALGDKPHGSGSGNTPFQSNLEQYHNPGGRPNAAANF